jgi:hypothetical protein
MDFQKFLYAHNQVAESDIDITLLFIKLANIILLNTSQNN